MLESSRRVASDGALSWPAALAYRWKLIRKGDLRVADKTRYASYVFRLQANAFRKDSRDCLPKSTACSIQWSRRDCEVRHLEVTYPEVDWKEGRVLKPSPKEINTLPHFPPQSLGAMSTAVSLVGRQG
jgi:hypothetical protein